MWIVTLYAILGYRRVDLLAAILGLLVGMAGSAKNGRSGRLKYYPRGIARTADKVAGETSHLDRRMHAFAFGKVAVALQTLVFFDSFVERHRMLRCQRRLCDNEQ